MPDPPKEMSLPESAELLGATSGEMALRGAGAHAWLRLDSAGQRKLSSALANNGSAAAPGELYLFLDGIRGIMDAAILNVFLGLPEGARPAEHEHLLAGSVSLYGLRAASRQDGAGRAESLDVTGLVGDLLARHAVEPEAIRVSVIPHHPLPDQVEIVIGRIGLVSRRK